MINRFSNVNRKKHPYDRVYTTFPVAGAYKLDYETFGRQQHENSLLVTDEIMMFSDWRFSQREGGERKEGLLTSV